jgi:hypothetical protein
MDSGNTNYSNPSACLVLTMGRTLPTISSQFDETAAQLSRFRRGLRRSDQLVLDDLLASARQHLPAAALAAHLLPFEVILLSMLVEEHKEVMRLRIQIEKFHANRIDPT